MQAASDLNRVVWMLWLQGFENAPELVRLCLRSWKARNPTWRVVELNDENLADYIDAETLATFRRLELTPVKRSNLIRLYLTSRHGGVWADATVFCVRPLDDWLPDYLDSGFFAFRFRTDEWLRKQARGMAALRERTGDRIVASWFLAAVQGNRLAAAWYQRQLDFFANNSFPLQFTERGVKRIRRLMPILNRNARTAQLWTTPLITKTARVYPYHILHYHFARIVTSDERCAAIWERTPTYFARGPLRLIRALTKPITEEQRTNLETQAEPMYKLTWKYKHEEFAPGCVLDYLLQSVPG